MDCVIRKMLTISEVAELLRVTERTVYEWANEGKIPASKIGNSWRFWEAEVVKWVDEKRNTRGSQAQPVNAAADARRASNASKGDEKMVFDNMVFDPSEPYHVKIRKVADELERIATSGAEPLITKSTPLSLQQKYLPYCNLQLIGDAVDVLVARNEKDDESERKEPLFDQSEPYHKKVRKVADAIERILTTSGEPLSKKWTYTSLQQTHLPRDPLCNIQLIGDAVDVLVAQRICEKGVVDIPGRKPLPAVWLNLNPSKS